MTSVVHSSNLGSLSRNISNQTQDSRPCQDRQHLSISKWANSNSSWCPSKSIWDREPSIKPISTTKDKVLTPGNQNVSKPAVSQGLKIETKRDTPWPKAPSTWTPLITNGVKPLSTQSSSSAQPDKRTTSNTDAKRFPQPCQKTNHLTDSRHARAAAQGPDGHRYQQSQPVSRVAHHIDQTSSISDLNVRASSINSKLSGRGPLLETIKMPWHMAMGGNTRQARSAEPVFKQFDEFLPRVQTNSRPLPEQSYTGHATSGEYGHASPITPHDGAHRKQSIEPNFGVKSLLGSDSSVSSLTHTFDSTGLNDASSRSSASRQSQESEARYGYVSPLDDRGIRKSMFAEDSLYTRQQRCHDPAFMRAQYGEDKMPEWRRGALNGTSQAGDNWPSSQDMGFINADIRLGWYDPISNGWQDPRDRYLDGRHNQDRREQQHTIPENAVDASASQLRQHFNNPYLYNLSMENSANGYQFMIPAHNLQQMLPVNVHPPQPSILEIDATQSVRSRLLNEYKTDKQGRRWELRDVYDHIVEFCGDQAGSKFIQVKLETANSEERDRVFREILPNACQLMCDVFGNYVMQRFFVHGDQSQKKILAHQMKGKVQSLAKQMYGCRVLQKALKHVLVDQQADLAQELNGRVLELIRDQNGNHVVQKVLKRIPWEHIPFVIDTCVQNLQQLAVHNYGCRVIQRLLRHYHGPMVPRVLHELHSCSTTLITDQYGNYVTQHIIQYGEPADQARMIEAVRQNLVSYAKQKFASNVVEKCIIFGNEAQRRDIMLQLCVRDSEGVNSLTFMIKDNYGNYVIQKLLDVLKDADYAHFVAMLEPEIARIRRSLPNKQAENVYQKMHRHSRYQPQQPSPPHKMHIGKQVHPAQQMQHMHQMQRMQSPRDMQGYGMNGYPRLA